MIWILIVIVFWLIILSLFVLMMGNHYKRLTNIGGKRDLQGILEKILDHLEEHRVDITKIKKVLEYINKEEELHIQKVGLVRFNPFPDTGGNQSFVLSLLDKNNNGVVISSLHARTTTRWYAKTVTAGKGKDVNLSKEEEKAINEAEKLYKKI